MSDRAVVAADVHLRKRTWASHQDLWGDSYHAFKQIIDACIQRQLPLLLLGDIFDARLPDSESVQQFMTQCNRMAEARLRVYYVQGNHDEAEVPWPDAISPSVRHVHGQSFQIEGVSFYGLDYTPRASLQEAIQQIPAYTKVVLMHQSWLEVQRVGNTDGELSWFEHTPLVLSGDYHEHVIVEGSNRHQQPILCVSPGSTGLQNLGERPEKSFYILSEDSQQQLVVQSCEIEEYRPLYDMRVTTPPQLNELVVTLEQGLETNPNLPEHLRCPIAVCRFPANLPDAHARLSPFADRYHLFLRPEPQPTEVAVAVEDDEHIPDVIDLEYAVGRLGNYDPGVAAASSRLLRSNDRERELEAMKQEFFHDRRVQATDAA